MTSEARVTVYGEFAANFVEDCLAKLCDPSGGIQTGPFGSQLHQQDYVPVGTPIITVEHLGENRIIHQDIPCVSDEDKERLSKYILRKGDIVFSRVGSVDRRSLVRDAENGWLFSGRCLRVRPDPDKIDPVYLSYFFGLPSFKEHIRAIAVGATMPSLNTEILSNVIVPYPQDLNEQHAIARILGSLDDKIEANRRMNETLEAMARSIFKSWFVDFDPVRAKAEGREPAGMDAETAALFPDSFEETELGMVPRGWKITSFTEAMEVNPTRFLKKGKAYSYLEMCNMPTNSARVIDIAGREFSSGTKFKNGDVLIARITPCLENGKVAFVDFLEKDGIGWGSTEFIVIRSRSPLPLVYAYFLARFEDFRSFLITNMTGTSGRQRVPTSCLSGYNLVIPSEKICLKFSDILRPIMAAIKSHDEESQILVSLINVLLPNLLSGKIRINKQ